MQRESFAVCLVLSINFKSSLFFTKKQRTLEIGKAYFLAK